MRRRRRRRRGRRRKGECIPYPHTLDSPQIQGRQLYHHASWWSAKTHFPIKLNVGGRYPPPAFSSVMLTPDGRNKWD